MNNSYITIIKEKRTALSRKRIPLNQNGCTANFRIGVPFEQNLQKILAGDRVQINTGTFSNDMTSFQSRDDILTLLVHLGYLSYHWPDKIVAIPNKEVSQEYVNAISTMDWNEVIHSVEASRKLL